MKNIIIKNTKIIVASLLIGAIVSFIISGMSWSVKRYSEILTYIGFAVAIYGAYLTATVSMMFPGKKKNNNERYSPEEKKEKERLTNHKLLEGWFTIFAAGIIIVISILVFRL